MWGETNSIFKRLLHLQDFQHSVAKEPTSLVRKGALWSFCLNRSLYHGCTVSKNPVMKTDAVLTFQWAKAPCSVQFRTVCRKWPLVLVPQNCVLRKRVNKITNSQNGHSQHTTQQWETFSVSWAHVPFQSPEHWDQENWQTPLASKAFNEHLPWVS